MKLYPEKVNESIKIMEAKIEESKALVPKSNPNFASQKYASELIDVQPKGV
ncbi:hypothetical protein ABI125_14505 [Tamlana crocina]